MAEPTNEDQSQSTLLHARWIVPVVPSCTPLEWHALRIDGSRIESIEPSPVARERYPHATHVELPEHLLTPGLVNAHTHAAMSLLRGIGSDAVLQSWLENYIWPLERRWADANFVRDGTRLAVAEMLLSGTTCFADMYFFPATVADVSSQIGIRAQIGGPLIDMPTHWSQNFGDGLKHSLEVLDTWHAKPLITVALAPHSVYVLSGAQMAEIAECADRLDARVHIHAHETKTEIAYSIENHGARPLQLMAETGLTKGVQAAHLVHLNATDLSILTEHQIQAVHCPSSNLKLASGVCDLKALLRAGVNVGLGTDGPASNDGLDMLAEIRMATLLARGHADGGELFTADEALKLGTIGGARVLGLDAQIGSLEPGKYADIVAFNFSHPRTQPVHDVVAQLVYAASSSQVQHVWVDGVERVRNRELLAINSSELKSIASRWSGRFDGTP